jgi:glycogen debranching enzyme
VRRAGRVQPGGAAHAGLASGRPPQHAARPGAGSINHADGHLAAPPIALCEVQAHVYAAFRARAEGHCLWCGIVDDDKAAAVAAHLTGPDLDSGFGVRTPAVDMGANNPISHHNGSVWPHDTAIAVAGPARYGFAEPVPYPTSCSP